MAIAADALVLIDYTSSIKGDGEVYKTTRGRDADKLASKPEGDVEYRPVLVCIGDQAMPVPPGVAERLAEASSGDEFAVDVPPEKAFGRSDRKKLRTIPLRKLGEDADRTVVGDTVEIDERKGIVKFKTPGRVSSRAVAAPRRCM